MGERFFGGKTAIAAICIAREQRESLRPLLERLGINKNGETHSWSLSRPKACLHQHTKQSRGRTGWVVHRALRVLIAAPRPANCSKRKSSCNRPLSPVSDYIPAMKNFLSAALISVAAQLSFAAREHKPPPTFDCRPAAEPIRKKTRSCLACTRNTQNKNQPRLE